MRSARFQSNETSTFGHIKNLSDSLLCYSTAEVHTKQFFYKLKDEASDLVKTKDPFNSLNSSQMLWAVSKF
jgi:hypothetical protein